MTTSNEVY